MAGRKPVHLTAASGKVSGRQSIWQAIRALRRDFTVFDLMKEVKEERDVICTYVDSLAAAGIIKAVRQRMEPTSFSKIRPNPRGSSVYDLVIDSGIEAPRVRRDGTPCTQGLPREQMWRTMGMVATFTWRDLAGIASTDTVTVNPVDAKAYVQALHRAGYLQVVRPSKPGTQAVYRLIKNTGPRPPMIQRTKVVFDPNIGAVVWHQVKQ